MFAANDRISSRQLERMIFVQGVGNVCIVLPYWCSRIAGKSAMLLYASVMAVGIVYGLLCLWWSNCRGKQICRIKEALWYRKGLGSLCAIKYLFLAVVLLLFSTYMIMDVLLPEVNWWMVMLLFAAVGGFAACQGTEARARTAECIYIIWLLVFVVMAVLLLIGLPEKWGQRLDWSKETNLFTIVVLVMLATPFDILLFSQKNIGNEIRQKKLLFNMLSIAAIGIVLFYATLRSGMLGSVWYNSDNRIHTLEYIKMLKVSGWNIWGLESIWVLSLLGSMLLQFSSFLQISGEIFTHGLQKKQKQWFICILTAAIWVSGVVFAGKEWVLPVADKKTQKVQLEERSFVRAMYISAGVNEYQVLFDFADLNDYTQNEIHTQSEYTAKGDSLKECISEYEKMTGYFVDFTHLQAILFPKDILKEDVDKVILEMSEIQGISGETALYQVPKTVGKMEAYVKNIEDSMGDVIERRMKKNPMYLYQYGSTGYNILPELELE